METQLYYFHVPAQRRSVSLDIDFMSATNFIQDEPACSALWEMLTDHFHTRSKFLAIWPNVRHVAVHRRDGALAGCLLVSTAVNWQIDYVVVRSDMRHQGISAALVDETLNQALARGVPYVMLTSRESLRPLYECRCGFRVVGRSGGNPTVVRSIPKLPTQGNSVEELPAVVLPGR